MRSSVFISLLAHLALVVVIQLQWPNFAPDLTAAPEVVPIDIVVGEVTDVAAMAPPLEDAEPPPQPDETVPEEAPMEQAAAPPPEPRPQETARPRERALDYSDLRRRLLENRDAQETGTARPDNAREGPQVREGAGRSAGETASLAAYFAALAEPHRPPPVLERSCWSDGHAIAANPGHGSALAPRRDYSDQRAAVRLAARSAPGGDGRRGARSTGLFALSVRRGPERTGQL